MTDDDLLPKLARALQRWRGWTHRRDLTDDHGRYALIARHADAGAFVAVCKRSLHDGDVSVMERAVDAAARGDASVAVFVGETPTLGRAWAFAPGVLRRAGETFQIESKRGARVDAIQIDPDHGACVGDVVSGRAAVPTTGDRQERLGVGR